MGNFDVKVQRFLDIFIGNQAYLQVLEGLKNTLIIAVTGLLIGIVIGTLIATVRVIPKYKLLPRVLNVICSPRPPSGGRCHEPTSDGRRVRK